jgi:hypothetical protein
MGTERRPRPATGVAIRSTAVVSWRSSSAAEMAPRHSPISDSRERQREVSRSRSARSACHLASLACVARRSANNSSRFNPHQPPTTPSPLEGAPHRQPAWRPHRVRRRRVGCRAPRRARRPPSASHRGRPDAVARRGRTCELELLNQLPGAHRPTTQHEHHPQQLRAAAAPKPSTGRPSCACGASTRLLVAVATTTLRTSLTRQSQSSPECRQPTDATHPTITTTRS